ncbi:hypothetical protein K290105B7_19170 [Anaerostipes caccae]|uniref:Uncharacterized protein n=1 Tax=Anaerostipes caccae (strain DSM 14662 / CCUG 47493 / JCM 13470 / NCIMB 13811 / L1-92) TaxID=411490 RepID=B0MJE8_ANACD|nr:hypothetical protein ANACAC_03760 [Anaerostipes caccae L1-92]BCD36313.1 hypothetical protein ANCC_23490 [Anaerostipes caccae L1-92]
MFEDTHEAIIDADIKGGIVHTPDKSNGHSGQQIKRRNGIAEATPFPENNSMLFY